jgi:protein-S-isoprenylcysteine O-methyltransferase Ste14
LARPLALLQLGRGKPPQPAPGTLVISRAGRVPPYVVEVARGFAVHLLGPRLLGAAILLLLGMLVLVKRTATGSVLDRPHGAFLVQLVNAFNLFFLLVVNPLAAVSLLAHPAAPLDPTHFAIATPWVVSVIEISGAILYAAGFLLMAWALATLGRSYQLGGSAPRADDRLVAAGPYRLVRHPMYTAALAIALGLSCLVQSWAFLSVFCIYLVLILRLVPLEEDGLRKAYGERYLDYQHHTGRLIPFAV